ncbi:hypothetical protein QUR76_03880 [Arcobacter cryaerophilus gv. pseudocryaerophilus]|uniref:Gene product 88 domain-containing protein n=3 Tax=unclassified Arcobacter TaxID=2593671 RepID=A0AA96DKP1_9BACT|nr:hypothetical protein RMQ65_04215 [Arcobacter sp. AZ-2023]WPD06336.1 hypothetical protein QUR76_03880 [Arcobacter sp. DSM 115956]WPD08427.1 hypothetical protein QUR78_03880 [Arcobacter sp. DSM 115955]WNL32692.1 hypothetical protein RMQ67_03880 [Arcobacter sp. AZ-2023]WNP38842.1 hypothetical protein RJG58_03880 [Arcobacter sp. AZ-2023]
MKFQYLIPYYNMSGEKFKTNGYYQTYLTLNNFMKKDNLIDIDRTNITNTTIINKICPRRSLGCENLCFNIIRYNRKYINSKKTKFINNLTKEYLYNRTIFKNKLKKDLSELIKHSNSKNIKPVVRLNNMSDILWENIFTDIFLDFKDIQFYDYTKHNIIKRIKTLRQKNISNYHLVYSRTEKDSWKKISYLLNQNIDVAVVIDEELKQSLLDNITYNTYNVIDGDAYDNRILDKLYKSKNHINKGILILLNAVYTNRRKDSPGFVIKDINEL